MADDVVSVMGCSQQYQLCNPNLPKEKQCSPLAATMDNFENAKTLWPEFKKYDALKMPINPLELRAGCHCAESGHSILDV